MSSSPSFAGGANDIPPVGNANEASDEGDLMGDDPMVIERNGPAGDANELDASGEAEVGMDAHCADLIDLNSMQVEVMVRLLEEGLDQLKISADVISISPGALCRWELLISGEGAATVLTPLVDITEPPHSESNSLGTTGLTVTSHPDQDTATSNRRAATDDRLSFNKLDGIIKELTKKMKVGAKAEDLISVTLLSDYNILREHFRIEGDPTPDKTASLQIASCKPSQRENRLTKGPWFARRLREMANYVLKHRQLPERKQGKGGKHPSFLDEKDVRTAVEKFVGDCETGTVCLCPARSPPCLPFRLR